MPSTPTYKNLDALIEQPESGTLQVSDRFVLTKVYRALYSVCLANAPGRGTIGTGLTAGYLVSGCTVVRERGDIGKLIITWEAGGGSEESGLTLPADEFDVQPFEMNPRIERHPRYSAGPTPPLSAAHLRKVRVAVESENDLGLQAYDSLPTLGQELVRKIVGGLESYYWAGLRYTWTLYSWTTPDIYLGGVISAPGGPLAGYFHPDLQWLREADTLSNANGVYRLTRSWLGAEADHWDADIYPSA